MKWGPEAGDWALDLGPTRHSIGMSDATRLALWVRVAASCAYRHAPWGVVTRRTYRIMSGVQIRTLMDARHCKPELTG